MRAQTRAVRRSPAPHRHPTLYSQASLGERSIHESNRGQSLSEPLINPCAGGIRSGKSAQASTRRDTCRIDENSTRQQRISACFREKKSRPVSRVLSWTVIPLGTASPPCSSDLPGNDAGRVMVPLFGLAPGGVCLATRRCPRVRCALTAPFHPCHACLATPFGGLFSVALSVGSRRPGVTWHPALWSPDFPRSACAPRDCLADSARRIQGT